MSVTTVGATSGDLAARVQAAALRIGSFRLRSGVISDHYFDKFRFEADPVLLRDVATAMVPLLPPDTDALAGLELGGVPLATALGLITGLPMRFVRKAPKEYGTRELAEGGPIDGLRLTIIEDAVTSGGAILQAVAALRCRGAIVSTAVCAIDRETGGTEALAPEGVELRAVLRESDMPAAV